MRFYRRAQVWAVVLTVLCVALAVLLPVVLFPGAGRLMLFLLFPPLVFLLLGLFLLHWRYDKKFFVLQIRYWSHCDPESYLAQTKKRFKSTHRSKDEQLVLAYMAEALLGMGRWQEAKTALDQMDGNEWTKRRDETAFLYLEDRLRLHLMKRETEKAKTVLEDMKELLAFCRLPLTSKEALSRRYFNALHQVGMQQGAFAEAEAFFALSAQTAVTEYDRVTSRYLHGMACRGLGRLEEALQDLQYVIINGNRLSIVQQAKEITPLLLEQREAARPHDPEVVTDDA